jgi:hypothetical protein
VRDRLARSCIVASKLEILRATASRSARGEEISNDPRRNARAFPGHDFDTGIDDAIDIGSDLLDTLFK